MFQQEIKMRNLLIAACCAALVGSVSVASAQTSGPTSQDSMKTNGAMNANAKMKKKSTKKNVKSDDSMKSDTSKDGMKKDSK
jgi:pentapeptide MXKDX repeat protein